MHDNSVFTINLGKGKSKNERIWRKMQSKKGKHTRKRGSRENFAIKEI